MKNINLYIISIIALFTFSCNQDATSPSSSTSTKSGSEVSINNPSGTGTSGSTARFTIAKNHLYIATEDALYVYSLEKPDQPVFQSQQNLFGVETIFSLENNLYLGTQTGVLIFDITNPNSPNRISTYRHITSCDPVVVQGDFAFSTLRNSSDQCRRGINCLDVINVADKSNPKQVARVNLDGPIGLGIHNQYLYVCDNDYIKQFDVSDPSNPTLIRSNGLPGCFDIIVNGQTLIAVSNLGIHQYNIEQTGQLSSLSTILKD